MLVLQNTSFSVVVKLLDINSNPVTNLSVSDIVASIRREGDSNFTTISLTSGLTFFNNGSGYYTFVINSSYTNVLGSLYFLLKGTLFQDYLVGNTVVASAASLPSSPVITPAFGNIYGSIINSSGVGVVGAVVTAQLVSPPAIITSGATGAGVTNGQVYAKTDTNGYFALNLVAGVSYDVMIPSINFRKTILITPGSSINVFGV
jgi:hypothetical protein